MTLMRHFAELVRALAVLALVFLSYAHAPLASTSAGPAWSALSFCGDPVDGGDDRSHAPCHACRIGAGADLPPPCGPILAIRSEATVDYVATPASFARRTARAAFSARGPPAA